MTVTDTDRLAAIEARLEALPPIELRQRDGDAGIIEDADGQPIAVLGTSGPVRLPVAEFLAQAPADVRWLMEQLQQVQARAAELETGTGLDELRTRINHAGSLMRTGYVAEAIGHTRVPGERHPLM